MRTHINKWIKEENYYDCFELISKSMNQRQCVEWAIYSAELALPYYSGKSKKPLEAIEAAKRCLKENFSPESVKAAYAAADAAYAAGAHAAYADAYAYAAAAGAAYAANAAAGGAAGAAANAADADAYAYAADHAAANRKEFALKIINQGLEILTPTSVKFMKEITS
jgi:hypothetical protein